MRTQKQKYETNDDAMRHHLSHTFVFVSEETQKYETNDDA